MRYSSTLAVLLFTGLLTSISVVAQSGIYRWVDEQGNPQYSDIPPGGVKAEFIPVAGSKRSAPTEQSKEQETTAASPASAEESQLEILPPKDPALCAQAKSNLDAMNGRPRIRIIEADGSRRFLSGEEIEAQREIARKNIKMHCD